MPVQLRTKETVGRNDLCPCGSGLKYKFCHGDEIKRLVCNRIANEAMARLIMDTKFKKGLISKTEHNAYLNRGNASFVPKKDVEDLIESAGLKRCVKCGAVIPDDKELCIKCMKGKSE